MIDSRRPSSLLDHGLHAICEKQLCCRMKSSKMAGGPGLVSELLSEKWAITVAFHPCVRESDEYGDSTNMKSTWLSSLATASMYGPQHNLEPILLGNPR
jgi:hypothetical protein